ncbi:hypothetical protein ACRARG_17235 [Pseudooceanicola sp. C21-150M6]|uniref:hypothetical protein n=1 Tax=Pseudooceanicola sp. C21-150M6 TaxID=3434355 RepID=UPI003D7FC8E7
MEIDHSLARNVILVTGTPRSGTTVVGTQLGLARHSAALYEPMNADSGDRTISRYFECPGANGYDYDTFDDLVRRIAALTLRLKPGVFEHENGVRRWLKYVIGGQSRQSLRKARFSGKVENVIWKDPLAALSARAAVARFGLPLVITYRPPLAVAASFKRLNWRFNAHQMLETLGGAYFEDDPLPDRDNLSIPECAAAIWTMIYGELYKALQDHPGHVFPVTMDDLLVDPRGTYAQLYEELGLEATEASEAGIREAEEKIQDKEKSDLPSGHPHTKDRNISAANSYWSSVLDQDEIEVVLRRAGMLPQQFEQHFDQRRASRKASAEAV